MKSIYLCIIFLILYVCGAVLIGQDQPPTEKAGVQSFKLAPSYFIPNTAHQKTGKRLVEDGQVKAFVQTLKGRVLFTPSGAYIGVNVPTDRFNRSDHEIQRVLKSRDGVVSGGMARTVVLKAGFSTDRALKRRIQPRLEDQTSGIVNFMVGPKENWRTKVPTYRKLVYDQVWNGISLEYLGFMDRLEFRFQLEPGSDPNQIVLETGGDSLEILDDGRLKVFLAGAELILGKPLAYQVIDHKTVPVSVKYKPLGNDILGFHIGNYSKDERLVIDPTLSWSTYLGGPGGDKTDVGMAVALDYLGDAYITGETASADFPSTGGTFDETWNGGIYDVFVAKLSRDGDSLIFSSFLGGMGQDQSSAIAVDGMGNAYLTGYTESSDFPTTSGAFDESFDGYTDVFISKLSSDGSSLIFSSLLGSSGNDYGYGIALDLYGNAFITGKTNSSTYPTTPGAFDEVYSGLEDGFVTKLSSDGSNLLFSSLIGGSGYDKGSSIALDSGGNAYVTGSTSSSDYPTTIAAYDETWNGGQYDAFVCKVSRDGNRLIYSSYLGGSGLEGGEGIAVDSNGNAYVTGYVDSPDYPTTSGAFSETINGERYDVFVTKLSINGNILIYSSFLGGTESDFAEGIAVDSTGNAYVTGETYSSNYPTTSGAFNEIWNGDPVDAFVSKLNRDGSNLIYSTFLGGAKTDLTKGIVVDNDGHAYVTGFTQSEDYPSTSGAYDESYNFGGDGFVSELNADGSDLIFSSFFGGSGGDFANGVATDNVGHVYVTGYTSSGGYPTTSGVYDESYNANYDVVVSKLVGDDSGLIYSTFLGGIGDDIANGIAVDVDGNAYLAGYTDSIDYPTTSGAYGEIYNGLNDVFLSKLSQDGSSLIYSSFLGNTGDDYGRGIAVDNSGNAYVTGYTGSIHFPTTAGVIGEYKSGFFDAFVSKLSSNGNSLIYSTYLGGLSSDYGYGIAVDGDGNAYVTGNTNSKYFPTTSGAYDETYFASGDVFISKLNTDGSNLIYSSFLGGVNEDWAYGIAVDLDGNAYVTGYTYSREYPTTNQAFDQTYNLSGDGFVSKLSSDGKALIYSTYLGGSGPDQCYGIALDKDSNAYLTGSTYSNSDASDFPTTIDAYDPSFNGYYDVFVSKLNQKGDKLVFSTFLGGTDGDYGYGIDIDNIGFLYLTGETYSIDFPTTNGALNQTQNGYGDGFLVKLSLYLDFNQDGCSNPFDLSDILPYWKQIIEPDHTVSVLDLLMINLEGPVPCP